MISTRELSRLPEVDALRRLLQSMAMLDAILSPEWEYRYYSYNAGWSEGEQMGSMRNGSGDDFFALFTKSGCFLKGFAHETEMSPYGFDPPKVWPGVLDQVPPEFASCLEQPAFKIEDTTFCIWRRSRDVSWHHGFIKWPAAVDPDGSAGLLSPLDGRPETYHEWAEGYYEQAVDLDSVRHVYAHRPLTDALVATLNPEVSLALLAGDIQEITYSP